MASIQTSTYYNIVHNSCEKLCLCVYILDLQEKKGYKYLVTVFRLLGLRSSAAKPISGVIGSIETDLIIFEDFDVQSDRFRSKVL